MANPWIRFKGYIQCVSIPRSGHHLLMGLLDFYWPNLPNGWYCEHYSHCCRVPCPRASTIIAKNHDLSLQLAYDESRRYIVQWRHPLPSIVSEFRLRQRQEPGFHDSWQQFCTERARYWWDFCIKWVLPIRHNVCVVRYESMMIAPARQLRRVVQFIRPDLPVNEEWLQQVIAKADIASTDKTRDFPYLTTRDRVGLEITHRQMVRTYVEHRRIYARWRHYRSSPSRLMAPGAGPGP